MVGTAIVLSGFPLQRASTRAVFRGILKGETMCYRTDTMAIPVPSSPRLTETIHIPAQKHAAALKQADAAGLTMEAWILQAVERELQGATRDQEQSLIDRRLALLTRAPSTPFTASEAEELRTIEARLDEIDRDVDPIRRDASFEQRLAQLESGIAACPDRG